MKTLLTFSLLLLFTGAFAQENKGTYDAKLAQKLGADAYGMKNYIFVILVTGKYQPKDTAESNRLFAGHMANIVQLAKEGKLVVAGPFGKNDKSYRGLFILNASNKEEAMKYLQADPSIAIGLFDVELIPWYGSAALPEYLPIHDKIQQKSF